MSRLGRYAGTPVQARKEQTLDLLAALIAAGLIVFTVGGWPGAPRILAALAFTFFVPGRAIVTNWPRVAHWSAAAVPMLLSLAVLTLLATVSLWLRFWHPVQVFEVEAALSLGGLGAGMTRRHAAVQAGRWPPSGFAEQDTDA